MDWFLFFCVVAAALTLKVVSCRDCDTCHRAIKLDEEALSHGWGDTFTCMDCVRGSNSL